MQEIQNILWENHKNNPYLINNWSPVTQELETSEIRMEGNLPKEIQGTYYRNGPNPKFEPISYQYPFDGDGMIHALSFQNGKVTYKNKFIFTDELKEEIEAGENIYSGILSANKIKTKYQNIAKSAYKNSPFINIIRHAGKLIALSETSSAYELNENLSTKDKWKIHGQELPSLCAHPKKDFLTDDMYFMNYDFEKNTYSFVVIDKNENLKVKCSLSSNRLTMVHDFVLTENYLIFFEAPLLFCPKSTQLFLWDNNLETNIIILNKKSLLNGIIDRKEITTDSFFVFHHINAYEENGFIIIDSIKNNIFNQEKQGDKLNDSAFRTTIDLNNSSAWNIPLNNLNCEFPKINPNFDGQKYQYCYLLTDEYDSSYHSLLKLDVQNKKSICISLGENYELDEPVIIPYGDLEEECYILTYVYNKNSNFSEV